MRLSCIEMHEQSSGEAKEEVWKQMQDDTLDMPQYLLEALDILGEAEAKWYLGNH